MSRGRFLLVPGRLAPARGRSPLIDRRATPLRACCCSSCRRR